MIPFNPTKDKEVRATGAAPTQHAKKIELPLGAEWVKEFIKEHEKFPSLSTMTKLTQRQWQSSISGSSAVKVRA